MIYTAVFILSLSSLAFEILLTRTFSISQWNHLAFMVISIALLGFAASGIFLNLLSARGFAWEKRFSNPIHIAIVLALYAFGHLSAFLILNVLPLDYFMLPVEPFQAVYIFIAYGVLAFPFFICGIALSIAYGALPDKTGYVYFFCMFGSAVGAILPYLLIKLMDESTLVLIFGVLPLVAIPFLMFYGHKMPQRYFLEINIWGGLLILCLLSVGLILLFGLTQRLFDTHPSAYKALSQVLKFPDTHVRKTRLSLRGRLDTVVSNYIRYAPGLSIKYMGQLPNQHAIYCDGDVPLVFYEPKQDQPFLFADYTLDKMGYLPAPKQASVLVIVKSGGISIPCALSSNPTEITVIHENPQIADEIRSFYRINTVSVSARGFLTSDSKTFDIIHIDNRGASLPGASALDQEYSFTLESFKTYLSHLNTGGRLIITRRLILPPSDMIRMAATAYESLISIGIQNPASHMAIFRNWENYVLMVCKNPLIETSLLQSVSADMNFDMVYFPGISAEDANKYNIFDQPYYYEAIRQLFLAYQNNAQNLYFKTTLSHVTPQSDDNPFPYKFLKWHKLNQSFLSTGSRPYSLFLSGEILVLVVLGEALFISVLFLLIPLFFVSNGHNSSFFRAKFWYFFFVGAGFMLVEMYFIKKFVLVFGNPVISFSIVLSGILISSGLGGVLSQRMTWKSIKYLFFILLFSLFIWYLFISAFIHHMVSWNVAFQILLAIMIITPPGILMGFPFSLGMRYLAPTAKEKAYAWAANGCASVLTAVLSVHLALNTGFQVIILWAACAYFMAYLSIAFRTNPTWVLEGTKID